MLQLIIVIILYIVFLQKIANPKQVIDCSRLSNIISMMAGFYQLRNIKTRRVTGVGASFAIACRMAECKIVFYVQLGFSWFISPPIAKNCICSFHSLWLSTSFCCSHLESLHSAKKGNFFNSHPAKIDGYVDVYNCWFEHLTYCKSKCVPSVFL